MESAGPFPRLTGTADVSVRPALPADAGEIARVQAVTWRAAYRELLPAPVLEEWNAEAATAAWSAAAAAPPASGRGVLVALERDQVVGFAAFAPAEDDDAGAVPGTTEIATLLVEPRWGRRGHGSRLLAAIADLSSRSGAATLQVWLPEADPISTRFYESAGWAPDGWARTLDTGGRPLRELRWHTALDDERAT